MTTDELRARFEKWYVQNAFHYERDPIGSKLCGDQWTAWQACAADMQDVQREAERYRWLRSHAKYGPPEMGRLEWYLPRSHGRFMKLDEAIDAAMKGEDRAHD